MVERATNQVYGGGGAEEKRLAEERGSFHEGVPAITVVVDGGWSKQSHKHTYNANSGVGIIVGKETGKILHLGVRNKFCTACSMGSPKDKHECFKNWSASSSEMETDIIVEGFIAAERGPWCPVHEVYWRWGQFGIPKSHPTSTRLGACHTQV